QPVTAADNRHPKSDFLDLRVTFERIRHRQRIIHRNHRAARQHHSESEHQQSQYHQRPEKHHPLKTHQQQQERPCEQTKSRAQAMAKYSDVPGGRRRGWCKSVTSRSTLRLIVRRAQRLVFKNAVSLVQRLHLLLVAAAIRVMLRRLPFVLPLDVDLRGLLVDAQNPVVVFVRIKLAHRELCDSRGGQFRVQALLLCATSVFSVSLWLSFSKKQRTTETQ